MLGVDCVVSGMVYCYQIKICLVNVAGALCWECSKVPDNAMKPP